MTQHFARMTDGVVVEVIELPDGLPLSDAFPSDLAAAMVPCPAGTEQGAVLGDDGEFSPPAPPEPSPPPLLPITRRQLRLTLLAHDLLDQVEPAIAALPEPERSVATIEWQDASEYRRDHPLIAQIGAALDLDEAEIDAMWIEAMAA